jgi:uncharacterized membrane protein YbhN (UPF0104 family)
MTAARGKKRRQLSPWLSIPIGLALLAGAAWLLRHVLQKYSLSEATDVLHAMPWWRLELSVVITALGYAALAAHDYLALIMIRRKLPVRHVALAAFVAYAFANSAPFSFVVGGALRYRYYSRWGLSPRATTRVVTIGLTTYALGLLFSAALALTAGAYRLPHILHLPFQTSRPLGIIAGAIFVGYLAWVVVRERTGRPAHRRRRATFLNTLAQIGVSLADWILSAGALYVLLHTSQSVAINTFFGVFILGQLVALIAQIPGGLGVFDAVMIWGLEPGVRAPTTLAALVAYRLIYFLLPLVIATGILAMSELKHATRKKARA